MEVLQRRPMLSFLYVNQELLQNEEDDPRMARALALRKAVEWRVTSARRSLVGTLLASMSADGTLPPEFALSDEDRQVLDDMIAERRADAEMTYVENQITEVLVWVAEGRPGRAAGTERRRLTALQEQLRKRVFVGAEASALRALIEESSAASEPVRRQAVGKFVDMLADRPASLSDEEASYCTAEADRMEAAYKDGMTRLAQAGRLVVDDITRLMAEGKRLDHPHIYQYLSLLSHRFDRVRELTAEGAWLLRHNQFTIRFLSYFATKTTINPFMAVETLRLTREENEREMRRANVRRMRLAVDLLGRIGADYAAREGEYDLSVPNPTEFVHRQIASALTEVSEEESIADVVAEALSALRAADAARSDGPLYGPILDR